ncbi:hypothetical protein ISS30_06030 [bacterium]|nr:hypothetical protein [bacterium]
MDGIAPVDTGYIRSSVQEIGGILKEAKQAQIDEVMNIISIQQSMVSAAEILNAANELGGTIDFIA